MRSTRLLIIASLTFTLTACGDSGGPGTTPTTDGGVGDTTDTDGDGISNSDEGARDMRDTDGDGTPDYRDEDSDGDGIPDSVEAGDGDVSTPPRDSDMDTIPDFIDLDSDENGIPDATEGVGDNDGDGIPDFADLDDDNDFVSDAIELMDGIDPPIDTDGDGMPNFRDPDSDNDNILDGHEQRADTDGDGLLDTEDLDSDNDGIPDIDEAGDTDIRTVPVDTDGDTIPDFRDPDSDNDGLSDADEHAAGTSPILADTDGDGVTDLIEVAAETDALDETDSPRTRGDFVFFVPYMEAPDPTRDTLNFETSLQFADVYFNFDETGSMGAELTAMQNPTTGVPAIVDMLICAESGATCARDMDCPGGEVCNMRGICAADPRVGMGCIPDLWTGVGTFQDPTRYQNRLSLQPDPAMTATAVPGTGGGGSEAVFEAATCVADPMHADCRAATPNCAPAGTGVGCPGFRDDAVRILMQITDADNQCTGCLADPVVAGDALAAVNIKFMSLVGTDDDRSTVPGTPRSHAEAIGVASGTVDRMGTPYVYDALDAAVVPEAVAAVRALVNADNFRITIEAIDMPDDDGDALPFIERLEVNVSGGVCTMVTPTEDSDGDGFDDVFPSLRPGIPVCWDVVPAQNDTVMPARSPLVFKALLTVRADGSAVDSRVVFFLIPPDIVIGPPD